MFSSACKLHFHRVTITLICCGLLIAIMQGVGWLVRYSEQHMRLNQLEILTRSQMEQLNYALTEQMQISNQDNQHITERLTLLTKDRHIIDASVYNSMGMLIAHAGDTVSLRDKLELNGKTPASQFNRQLVRPIKNQANTTVTGFLRLTLETTPSAEEQRLPDYLINLLRILMLLSLIIGVVLTRTISRWHKSAG